MTNEEAIDVIKNTYIRLGRGCGKMAMCRALVEAIKALEKQTPKKPVGGFKVPSEKFAHLAKCPICGEYVSTIKTDIDGYSISRAYRYCYNCGQAIDWSEAEE